MKIYFIIDPKQDVLDIDKVEERVTLGEGSGRHERNEGISGVDSVEIVDPKGLLECVESTGDVVNAVEISLSWGRFKYELLHDQLLGLIEIMSEEISSYGHGGVGKPEFVIKES